MEKSLFSKIIDGEIPAYKIYEDEYIYAFLDIFPQQPGHTLIVPKIQVDHFTEVPEPYYTAIFQTAKKLSPALQKATSAKRICTSFLGYEIAHCHYHLVPTNTEQDMLFSPKPQANAEDLTAIQQKICSFLSQ